MVNASYRRAVRYRELARAIADDAARDAIMELAGEYDRQKSQITATDRAFDDLLGQLNAALAPTMTPKKKTA